MTPSLTTDTGLSTTEKSLLRFMASSARPLKKDPGMSALGAFDTLRKVRDTYQAQWLIVWIVCTDGYADITMNTPLQDAVDRIEAHGGAAGIVGLAVIAGSFRFLKKPLKVGTKIHKVLDQSGDAAADRFLKIMEPIAAEAKFLREQMEDTKKHS
jgi:hypothetical protein